jgi:hypothetical protein
MNMILIWVTMIVLAIFVLGGVVFFIIRDTDPFYAAFKGVLIILAGAVGGNGIQPHIEGTTSVDFRLDGILNIHSPAWVIKINPPDSESMDKSNSIKYMTWLAGAGLIAMLVNKKYIP